ncbi:MAG: hypothetical protein IT175_06280 [Acidobacteria bacterium]|nr:hypothetical protein [Acidobacteriota bacterium]
MVNLRGCHYPLDHRLYDADGLLVHKCSTWTWGQIPRLPDWVEFVAVHIETRNALGLVVKRTDLRPVIV